MDLRMVPPVTLCYHGNTQALEQSQAQKERAPGHGRPREPLSAEELCDFLGLVMDQRGLVEDLQDLGERRLLVGLLHRAELARQARGGGLENLPLGIALL